MNASGSGEIVRTVSVAGADGHGRRRTHSNSDDVALVVRPDGMPLGVGKAAVARTRQLLAGIVALVGAGLVDVWC